MEIPKIIHQSWKSGAQDLIEPEASIRKRLINMHPDWDFKFWTDEDNEKLIKNHYPWFLPYWNQYLWPIQKADAARYFYMHRYGGVYLDLDMLCLRSLDDLFEKIMKNQTQNIYSSTMKNAILFEEYPNSYSMQSSIYNAIMASLPFAPIWTMCFYVLQKNLLIQKQMKPNQDLEKIVFQTTGPKMLCEAFNKTLEGQRAKDTDLLPYFYTNPVALPTKHNSNELVIFNRMHTDPLFEAAGSHSSEPWRIIPREFLTPENLPNSYFSHRSNRTWSKDLSCTEEVAQSNADSTQESKVVSLTTRISTEEVAQSNADSAQESKVGAGHWKTKLSKVFICGEQMIHEGWSLPEKDFSPFRGFGKVNLLTFFESHFGWMQTNHKNMMQEFYDAFPKEDFIAIIHDPFDSYKYINKIKPYPDLVLDIIKKFCKGLFFLSQHESNKFKLFFKSIGINVPCESIYHPVKNTGVKFDFDCFYKMPNRQIISSGMHLRNASGILSQPLPDNYTMACTPWNQETEFYFTSAGHKGLKSINKLSQSKIPEYYKLYKDNIFYLNTLACVANNVLLDCIDSGCPILVNRNPSSEEYLGKNYPLFFDSLDQAYNILLEDSSIEVGHLYLTKLKAIRRERSLKDQILASKIYKSL